MTITAFTGKIRSGKSLGQLAYALDQCNFKRRTLVTNFQIDIKEAIKYCALKKYYWLGFQLQRGQYTIVDATVDLNKILSYPETVVCLDEAGIFLNARSWASTSKNLLYDLCQSGKDGIDLIYTCQFLDQVDSQMRALTQYYIHACGTTVWSSSLRRPRLVWKKYFYFDAEDYAAWDKDTKNKRNHIKTQFQYAFRTSQGLLNDSDIQLFKCFRSFSRLEKQQQSIHEPQHHISIDYDEYASLRLLQRSIQRSPASFAKTTITQFFSRS